MYVYFILACFVILNTTVSLRIIHQTDNETNLNGPIISRLDNTKYSTIINNKKNEVPDTTKTNSMRKLVEDEGYPFEEFVVKTQDGFLLKTFRYDNTSSLF